MATPDETIDIIPGINSLYTVNNKSTPSHSGVVCDAVISKSGSSVNDMAFSGVPIMVLINVVCMFVIIIIFGILLKFRIFNYYAYGEQDNSSHDHSDTIHTNGN